MGTWGIFAQMSQASHIPDSQDRSATYPSMVRQWCALIDGEHNRMANLANVASGISMAFPWHWVGFYLVDEKRDELVLGPFQGPVACTRLFHGKGVCASAWDSMQPVIVDDVQAFPGHVACSALTVSELVLPLVVEQRVVAVLDIDSIVPANFSQVDVEGFKPLLEAIQNAWMSWE